MGKWLRMLIAVLSAMVMVIAMCSCDKSKAENDQVFAGELVDAQQNRIVVMAADETILFETGDGTVYDLQGEKELCIEDQVEVEYHKSKDMFVADTVRLTAHKEQSQVFGGEVVELEDTYLTVHSESMTVVFLRDDETKIEGNLTKGDAVTVTYEGNLTENPRAISIVVIQERQKKEEKSTHGTVAEIWDNSVVVSVDSAHACRFRITKDTKIDGDDTKLKVGDEVHLVYTGTAGEDPVAVSITITRTKQAYHVMDGVIQKATVHSLTVKTAKKSYKFKIVDETRIQNPENMIFGHKTTITYAGDLNDNPIAASILCSKDTVTEKEKEKTTKATKATKATKVTEATKETKTTEPTEPTEPTDPTDPTEPTETTEATDPTEPTEPTETTEETETTEATETTEETEPPETTEATEAPKPTEEPETDPGYVVINAEGTITKWGNPCTIKVDGNGTVKLDISDASVSGGYIPEEGDQVKIAYDKDSMKLLSIQLVYRQADEENDE